jgi:hypothetical protein
MSECIYCRCQHHAPSRSRSNTPQKISLSSLVVLSWLDGQVSWAKKQIVHPASISYTTYIRLFGLNRFQCPQRTLPSRCRSHSERRQGDCRSLPEGILLRASLCRIPSPPRTSRTIRFLPLYTTPNFLPLPLPNPKFIWVRKRIPSFLNRPPPRSRP